MKLLFSPARVIVYLPAATYRLALKATVIFYMPLLWAMDEATQNKPFKERLEDLQESKWTRVIVTVSWVTGFLFVGKVFLYLSWARWEAWWNQLPLAEALNVFVIPHKMPLWHYAAALNAALFLALYYTSDGWLRKLKKQPDENKPVLEAAFNGTRITRGVLSSYAIFCNIVLLYYCRDVIKLPEIGAIIP